MEWRFVEDGTCHRLASPLTEHQSSVTVIRHAGTMCVAKGAEHGPTCMRKACAWVQPCVGVCMKGQYG